MDLDEIIYLINMKRLNSKTNNCIITNLDIDSEMYLLNSIKKQSFIINSKDIDENGFSPNQLINVVVDLNVVDYFNILNFALEQLNIEERIKLESIRDLLKFKQILMRNKKAIQFIITNLGMLDEIEIRNFNLLLWFNSFLFNSIILLREFESLSSYQIPNGTFLDSRENYFKIQLRK